MPKRILMEQFHVTVTAPAGLPKVEYDAMQRTLRRKRFQTGLRDAVRDVIRRCASLSKTRVTLDR